MKFLLFFLLFYRYEEIYCGSSCGQVTRLKMTEEGKFCTESASMGHMTCQNAWDDDIVTNTIWHPGSSGLDESTTIYVNKKIIITKVTVQQYKWDTGYASKMSLNINGDIRAMRPVKRDFEVMEYSPLLPLTTSSVQLVITEVGPWTGSAFGGIVAIRIFGCYEDTTRETDQLKSSPRSQKQEADSDWLYDYEDDDANYEFKQPADDDKVFDNEESVEIKDKEPIENDDWHIFGSFGSDGKLEENDRKWKAKRQEKENTEERLEKSNWPKFDSRSQDYKEPSVMKEIRLPESNRTLYIISGVVLVITIILVSVILVYGFKSRKVYFLDEGHEKPRVLITPKSRRSSFDSVDRIESFAEV